MYYVYNVHSNRYMVLHRHHYYDSKQQIKLQLNVSFKIFL